MAIEYKVWVEVEKVDEENDVYETVPMPILAGVFSTHEEADRFVIQLTGFSTKEDND